MRYYRTPHPENPQGAAVVQEGQKRLVMGAADSRSKPVPVVQVIPRQDAAGVGGRGYGGERWQHCPRPGSAAYAASVGRGYQLQTPRSLEGQLISQTGSESTKRRDLRAQIREASIELRTNSVWTSKHRSGTTEQQAAIDNPFTIE